MKTKNKNINGKDNDKLNTLTGIVKLHSSMMKRSKNEDTKAHGVLLENDLINVLEDEE